MESKLKLGVLSIMMLALCACTVPTNSSSEDNHSSSIEESLSSETESSQSSNETSSSEGSSSNSSSSGSSSSSSESSSSSSSSQSSSSSSSSSESSSSSSETTSSSSSNSNDFNGYYASITDNMTGTTLLTALQSLNSKKRTKTVGYKNMGQYYKQTDGDPNNSGNILSFYSGKSTSFNGSFSGSVNREHVWPNSHGGNLVEGDIHMPRPTIVSENGSRGNSFYVEGMKSSSNGWDPAMESFGVAKYRGISARIIFYCVVASSQLSLVDSNSGGSNQMGKLSDILKWNLAYTIDATETRRNEAAQGIQGNRNPFIDHPEYACKIWGNYNTATKTMCGIN